jgi:CSLREA domain-containing protein
MKRYFGLLLPVLITLAVLATIFALADLPAPRLQPAQAAARLPQVALVVNTLEDELNSDGDCSLREAVTAANTNAVVDSCPAGEVLTDTITFGVAGTITVTSQLSVTAGGPLVIDGGEAITTSGGRTTGVWWVEAGSVLTLQHLAVVNGHLESLEHMVGGAGLYNNAGSVSIIQCEFLGNHFTSGGGGGGICSRNGTLTILDSRFEENGSIIEFSVGGAIAIEGGMGTIERTSIQNNYAFGRLGMEICMPGGGGLWLSSTTVSIHESSILTNSAQCGAGGIYNAGTLSVSNSILSGNTSWYNGGAILNDGTLTVSNSSISGNSVDIANCSGGAIFNTGMFTVTDSSLYGNSAAIGGAIANNIGTLWVSNTTLSGNSAFAGGAIGNDQTLTVINSTLTDNEAEYGGGIFGGAILTNTIVAFNVGGDCGDTIADGGHNLDSDGTCGFDPTNGSLPNTDPMLGPLQDNGGPSWTHALLIGSPAIDSGDDAQCPATDQRGVSRPIDGDVDGDAVCDIGSYEFQPGMYLNPPVQSGSGAPGANVNYTIQLYNWTTLTDTYSLVLGAHTWETNLSIDTLGPLPPGGSQVLSVTVSIPQDASWYEADTVVITATSITSPTIYSATAQVTTTVVPITPTAVTMSGSETGWVGESQFFTATVEPIYASLPVTYTWQSTGQDPVIHTGGITDTVAFTWHSPGVQIITVTAANLAGSVVDTHAITISDVPIEGLSASNNGPTVLGNPTTFTATVAAGTNVSFAWNFGDDTVGNGAVVTHTYSAVGTYTATLTASNSSSVITTTTQVTIVAPSYPLYLPIILKAQQAGNPAAGVKPGMVGYIAVFLSGGVGVGWWLRRKGACMTAGQSK